MSKYAIGVDYGTQEFLFKKGILEGASMPFAIKLDFSYLFLPILVLNAISIFLLAQDNLSGLFLINFNKILYKSCCLVFVLYLNSVSFR